MKLPIPIVLLDLFGSPLSPKGGTTADGHTTSSSRKECRYGFPFGG